MDLVFYLILTGVHEVTEPLDTSTAIGKHYETRIGRSTSPAGNDWPDPYFRLSCVIAYFGKFCVAAYFSITCQAVINLTVS